MVAIGQSISVFFTTIHINEWWQYTISIRVTFIARYMKRDSVGGWGLFLYIM